MVKKEPVYYMQVFQCNTNDAFRKSQLNFAFNPEDFLAPRLFCQPQRSHNVLHILFLSADKQRVNKIYFYL